MQTRARGSLLLVLLVAALPAACGGDGQRAYYTPPTRSPAAASSRVAQLPTQGPTSTPTLVPGDPGTPYPTASGLSAEASRARALEVCPQQQRDLCVSSFVIVDAGPGLGALCIRSDNTFYYELTFFPAAPLGVPFAMGQSQRPDQGTGVPCKQDRGATAVALVGQGK